MSLAIEDGTLTVPNAVSWVSAADVVAWCDARGLVFDGTTAEREAACVAACDELRDESKYPYEGARVSATQPLPWPREGASYRNGPAIASTAIPRELKDAQCYAAYLVRTGTDLQPALDRGGQVKREKVGPLETEYFAGAPAETVYPKLRGYLAPLLRAADSVYPEPYAVPQPELDGFEAGQFTNPPTGTYDP